MFLSPPRIHTSSQAVVDKLRPCGQISSAEVARAAEQAGRRRLATMLLDMEPLASDQVMKLFSPVSSLIRFWCHGVNSTALTCEDSHGAFT